MSLTRATGWALFVTFLVLLVLKATVQPEWSWWWVTAPLWIGPAAGTIIVTVGLVAVLVWDALDRRRYP